MAEDTRHHVGKLVPGGRALPPDEAHLAAKEAVVGREVKRTAGRPTKCTMALLEQLAQLIQGGVHAKDACGMAGISPKQRGRWMEKGRAAMEAKPHSRSIYAEFVRVVEGKSAIARGVMGAKLHKMGREGNIAAIQTWMKYFGIPQFQPPNAAPDADHSEAGVVTIEFDGAQVFGGKELGEDEDEEEIIQHPDTDEEEDET